MITVKIIAFAIIVLVLACMIGYIWFDNDDKQLKYEFKSSKTNKRTS